MRTVAACVLLLVLTGCAGSPPRPAALDSRNDACATCRMAVSNASFAAQVVAPGEEPLFFDDIGCLADYLRRHPTLAPRAIAYVADHRTREWVPAATATFTSVESLDPPMGSHVIAHASPPSRDADTAARTGVDVPPTTLLPTPIPDGTR